MKEHSTDDEARILAQIIDEAPASHLLTVPGIWEILREEYNNEILTIMDAESEDEGDHGLDPCPKVKAGVKCECGSNNTAWVSGGGYQDADASRGLSMIETNGQIACDDCGRTWWD